MTELPAAAVDLRAARARLRDLCTRHRASVESFRARGQGPWFYLDLHDPEPDGTPDEVHHLSSSASSIESLVQVGPTLEDDGTDDGEAELVERFARLALARPHVDWESEGGAHTYCRVRTLPIVAERCTEQVIKDYAQVLAEHVSFVWRDVQPARGREAIVEHTPDPTIDAWAPKKKDEDRRAQGEPRERRDAPRYPPNAFLTYWAVRLLRAGRNRAVVANDTWGNSEQVAVSWSWETLAAQVALFDVQSEDADPHQLAWAMSTVAAFGDPEDLRRPASIDLLRAGMAAFFAQQTPSGLWPRGHPLFHYPISGNAYCYVFETLAELLRIAADDPHGLLQRLLFAHRSGLLRAAENAELSREQIGVSAVGWCSRHHPHRTYPESWATAAVFSFLECLRRLVGRWSADEARRVLGVRAPRPAQQPKAEKILAELGQSWPVDGWTIGDRMAALFLNPILVDDTGTVSPDPDMPLIRKTQARSAILFGPPGTGKTSMVEVLAGALGWEFVEVNASDFLAEGMDNVARRADEIFNLVMELDRCIVLFDEIDELLRDRRDENSDPFGRFLTTSMLPKLAKLWDQRRILFFANTNLVEKADPAIRRSQRFDAAFFVLPPRLERKLARLGTAISEAAATAIREADIDRQLRGEVASSDLLWVGLIRWDQMNELLARISEERPAELPTLINALGTIGAQLAATDWAQQDEAHVSVRFKELLSRSRMDFGKDQLARFLEASDALEGLEGSEVSKLLPMGYAFRGYRNSDVFATIPLGLQQPPETLMVGAIQYSHVGLLRYRRN